MRIASKEYVIKKMTELMITPKKKFSQNFLTDYETVVKAIDSLGNDLIQTIEIGPGLGALTQELADRKFPLDAYDIDKDMYNHLSAFFVRYPNVKIFNEDFLKVDLNRYQEEVNIISNLPYNITTPLIEKIVTSNIRVKKFEFMVQKEVYDRINAKVGSKDYSPLNIYIQYVGTLSIVRKVPKTSFIPVPNVDSIILMIEFNKEISKDKEFNKLLYKLIKASFTSRRKTLLNNLSSFVNGKENALNIIEKANLNPLIRPDQMELDDYLNLAKVVYMLNK